MRRAVLLLAPLLLAPTCGPADADKPGGDDSGGPFDGSGDTDDPDADGDGYAASMDCDDSDPAISPDADEVCDGVDNDCDGTTDDAYSVDAATWYADDDGDRYGDPDVANVSCYELPGWVSNGLDCDDADPDHAESCDVDGEVGDIETSPATGTCSPVGTVSWDLVTEWTYEVAAFLKCPAVAPSPGNNFATVALDARDEVILLDGRDGSERDLYDVGEVEDDGSCPAIGNADRVGGLEFFATHWQSTLVLDLVSMTGTEVDTSLGIDETVLLADVDQDGQHEFLTNNASYRLDGTLVTTWQSGMESTGLFTADLNGDDRPEVVTSEGIYDTVSGRGFDWPSSIDPGYSFYGGPVLYEGEVGVLFVNGREGIHMGRVDGSLEWSLSVGGERFLGSIGDATGDGVPDTVFQDGNDLLLVGLGGTIEQTWTFGPNTLDTGGASMADLDADGVYEIVLLGYTGFWILDGTTGGVLAHDASLSTAAFDRPPVIADVDGDSSAEILVLVDGAGTTDLVVLGPDTGRWARTRPVWNQQSYDITSIEDDGDLVSHPIPAWETYGAYRAQPAHDGDLADLALSLDGTEVDGDRTTLSWTVSNSGSLDGTAASSVQLYANSGGTWTRLDSVDVDAIPAGYSASGSFSAPSASLGDMVQLLVEPAETDCNYVNNQEEWVVE